jgi:predicted anti-sigma-YlaC factor YlaD
MTQFSDELLSAYLDGEATAEERAAVEARLAASEADRKLLEELQALRGEFQSLPPAKATAGFTDRVMQAAVAAKSREEARVAPAGGTAAKRSLPWAYWAAAALGLAACAVLVVQNWPGDGNVVTVPQGPSPAELLIADLHRAAPAEGEAVVVRLRVAKTAPLGQALEMALAEAGISQLPAFDTGSGAIQLGAAYRQQVQAAAADNLVAASGALFVSAPLEQIEEALKSLAAGEQRKLQLAAEMKLALADLPRPEKGEGEAGSESTGQPFSQTLNAGMFKLEKRDATSTSADAALAQLDRRRSVTILILIEQVE